MFRFCLRRLRDANKTKTNYQTSSDSINMSPLTGLVKTPQTKFHFLSHRSFSEDGSRSGDEESERRHLWAFSDGTFLNGRGLPKHETALARVHSVCCHFHVLFGEGSDWGSASVYSDSAEECFCAEHVCAAGAGVQEQARLSAEYFGLCKTR